MEEEEEAEACSPESGTDCIKGAGEQDIARDSDEDTVDNIVEGTETVTVENTVENIVENTVEDTVVEESWTGEDTVHRMIIQTMQKAIQ